MTYLRERHLALWIGIDHLLFLLCLLPAAWRPVGKLGGTGPAWRPGAGEIVKVVTALPWRTR